MEFVWIKPGGSFTMGTSISEVERGEDEGHHYEVVFLRGFIWERTR